MATPRPPWNCPRCRRPFRNRNQAHSCASRTVESFFGKRPDLRPLFDAVVGAVERFGTIRIDASPSGINIAARSHFCGAKVTRDGLRVGFLLRRPLASPRVIHREPLGRGRVAYRVLLKGRRDLDAELRGWLREAFDANVGAPR